MILDLTTMTLQAVLAGAVAANQPEVHVGYMVYDKDGQKTKPAIYRAALNNTTDVTILPAPPSGYVYEVISLSIYNKDTASVTVTVKTDTGTERIVTKVTLLTLETLGYAAGEWFALDANGNRKEVTSSTFSSLTVTGNATVGGTLGVTGLLSVGAGGINLTSAAGTSYIVATHVTTVAGYAADPAVTATITKIGNRIFITIPTFTGTSDAVTKAFADNLAAAYRPAAAHEFNITAIDNGGTAVAGVCRIATDGAVTFYPTPAAGNWTAANAATVSQASTHYV